MPEDPDIKYKLKKDIPRIIPPTEEHNNDSTPWNLENQRLQRLENEKQKSSATLYEIKNS